uniref:septum site-determining protein MinC n=1 Tax=Paenibacillus sp. KS-LC4 TaxID=2979727 RepID=UPI00403F36A3
MVAEKQHIMIKGVKEGLVFLLDDSCELDLLLDELHYKLEKTHQQLLTGPLVHVHVKLGSRQLDDEDKERIRSVIRTQGNLIVQSVESEPPAGSQPQAPPPGIQLLSGIIRSGQTIEREGDLLLTGDVNPGGTIISTGDIYVMGALRGVAHAGVSGRTDVIIAASLMRPTQLRIADIISRPPEEWMSGDLAMEFAFLNEGTMQMDKISQLYRLRNNPIMLRGV